MIELGSKKIGLFAPLPFEVPLRYWSATERFGMGPQKARNFAKRLHEQHSHLDWIIVYGCAGALHPDLKPGGAFVVSELHTQNGLVEIPSHRLFEEPKIRIKSSPVIVGEPAAKKQMLTETGAQMVEMEMEYIFESLEPSFQKRIIFLRGVLDSVHDPLDLSKWSGYPKLASLFWKFQRGIAPLLSRALQKLSES